MFRRIETRRIIVNSIINELMILLICGVFSLQINNGKFGE